MDPKRFTRRLVALGAVMFLCALVFVVTLFDAQIVNGDDYLAQSVRANAKVETVKGTRGVITDRNGKVLVSNRAVYTLDFDSSLVPDDELNDALLRVLHLPQTHRLCDGNEHHVRHRCEKQHSQRTPGADSLYEPERELTNNDGRPRKQTKNNHDQHVDRCD